MVTVNSDGKRGNNMSEKIESQTVTMAVSYTHLSAGRIWGTIFFLCMFFAACSTIIAVFENLIAFVMDLTNCSRTKAVVGNLIVIIVLSLPRCV